MLTVEADVGELADVRDLGSARSRLEAFENLVERAQHGLVNYLARTTGSRESAEEFAQEAFLRLYRVSGRFDDISTASAYLYRIATNLVRSHYRRSKRWMAIVPKIEAVTRVADGTTPQAVAIREEECERVQQALLAVPLHYREPLVLHEIEGWSYEQISKTLGCRIGTVKSRINRGRARLREQLEAYWSGKE